jgi:hypothetical protein
MTNTLKEDNNMQDFQSLRDIERCQAHYQKIQDQLEDLWWMADEEQRLWAQLGSSKVFLSEPDFEMSFEWMIASACKASQEYHKVLRELHLTMEQHPCGA